VVGVDRLGLERLATEPIQGAWVFGGGGGGGSRWNLGDVLTGVLLAHLVSAGNHLEELGELDGVVAVVVDVGDHLLELLVLDLEAKGAHCRRA